MSKELIAALAFGLAMISAIFAGGMRIGTLTERLETQTKQLDMVIRKVDSIGMDLNGTRLELLRLMNDHTDKTPRTERTR